MPVEKATTTKRVTKKMTAVTEAAKPKKTTTADTTKIAPPKKTVSPAKAASSPSPAKAASKASGTPKTAKPKPMAEATKTPPAKAKRTKKPVPALQERQVWIATAAYHRAEKRGFAAGYEVQDWLDAEAEINALVGEA
jgi:hypothetical protein